MSKNSLGAKKNLNVGGKDFEIFDINGIEGSADLPFSLKILLENLSLGLSVCLRPVLGSADF